MWYSLKNKQNFITIVLGFCCYDDIHKIMNFSGVKVYLAHFWRLQFMDSWPRQHINVGSTWGAPRGSQETEKGMD
jgi:hypothetical protein